MGWWAGVTQSKSQGLICERAAEVQLSGPAGDRHVPRPWVLPQQLNRENVIVKGSFLTGVCTTLSHLQGSSLITVTQGHGLKEQP